LAVSPRAVEQAYRSLRRGGTLVFVALPADNEIELPIFETVLNGITIVGSIVGTRKDLREVFELHAAGKTRVIRETRPLDQVNEAIADVEAGRVAARIVLEPKQRRRSRGGSDSRDMTAMSSSAFLRRTLRAAG
jgi:propanol-preferring alcohol dehydrogenase